HQRALPVRGNTGQGRQCRIDLECRGLVEGNAVKGGPALRIVFAIGLVVRPWPRSWARCAPKRIVATAVDQQAAGNGFPDETAASLRLDPVDLARGEVGVAASKAEVEIDGGCHPRDSQFGK